VVVLEGFQAAIHPEGYMGGIYSARDVQAFHTTLAVWCGELELAGSVTTHTGGSVYIVSHAKRMVRLFLITPIFN